MQMDVYTNLAALSLWGAFLLGLTGGFGHCLAMCGPFVAAASMADGSASCATGAVDGGGARLSGARAGSAAVDGVPGSARAAGRRSGRFQLAYHSGRLTTYVALGALLGLLGEAGVLSSLAGPASPVSITRFLKLSAGAVMIVMGVVLFVAWARGRQAKLPEPMAALAAMPWFGRTVSRLAASGGRWGFPLGALMGLLPCAPLLPVEIAALATGNPLFGALTMLAFGIGTVPALAGFGAASGLLGARARGWFAPVAAAAVVILGAVTVAQGVALLGRL